MKFIGMNQYIVFCLNIYRTGCAVDGAKMYAEEYDTSGRMLRLSIIHDIEWTNIDTELEEIYNREPEFRSGGKYDISDFFNDITSHNQNRTCLYINTSDDIYFYKS